jgi:hypothetical protein
MSLFSHNRMAHQLKQLFVAKVLITLENFGTKFFEHVRHEVCICTNVNVNPPQGMWGINLHVNGESPRSFLVMAKRF